MESMKPTSGNPNRMSAKNDSKPIVQKELSAQPEKIPSISKPGTRPDLENVTAKPMSQKPRTTRPASKVVSIKNTKDRKTKLSTGSDVKIGSDSDPFLGTESDSPTTSQLRRFLRCDSPEAEKSTQKFNLGNKSIVNSSLGGMKPMDVLPRKFSSKIPTKENNLKLILTWANVILALLFLALVIWVVFTPLIIAYGPLLRERLMFVGWRLRSPAVLKHPTHVGFECSTQRSIKPDNSTERTISMWFINPSTECEKSLGDLSSSIVLYVPTVSDIKSDSDRVSMMKMLVETLNYAVVTFDYSGIADSVGDRTSVKTTEKDTILVFQEIRHLVKDNRRIILWGDSWGGAVLLKVIQSDIIDRNSFVILQSVIASTAAAGGQLPFNWSWRYHLNFRGLLVCSLAQEKSTQYNALTTAHHTPIEYPILILQGEDNRIVTPVQSKKVYENILQSRFGKKESVHYKQFEQTNHELWANDDLPKTVKAFIDGTLRSD